jgi:hypothetical protein
MMELLAGWGIFTLFTVCVLSLVVATLDRGDE